MYRTFNCGALNIANINEQVILSGWIQKSRDLGGMTFIDLRDRYGVTQLVFNMETMPELCEQARKLGREYVIQAEGKVSERSNKNPAMQTGDIEIIVKKINILSKSETPPFTIQDDTDGGDELRMKYRYLDMRRNIVKNNILLRHRMAQETRNYLTGQDFIEIETPFLIKSTPEGARDFVVPSRLNKGEFYALPQSPQTFKQLLMVSGFDKYFQIVKCFRDEDLRADRQPEFTQIDCEMSFVHQQDVMDMFEGLVKHLLLRIKDIKHNEPFLQMPYDEALNKYGSDRPDLRFEMQINELTDAVKGNDFRVFDQAEYIGGIVADNCADYSRKQLDALTAFVQKPQIGAKGLVYVKYNMDGTIKSSVDKFYTFDELNAWMSRTGAKKGGLLLILAGEKDATLSALGELRLEMGRNLGLINNEVFAPLWVTDFPLLEWDKETEQYHAMHHPFTSPKEEDIPLFDEDPGKIRANAYDLVINGVEIGGGSIRIHDQALQEKMFSAIGFSKDEAQKQFGFLMDAFQFGAPPHGGIAFGFDRWAALFAGVDSIKEVIAFPKNNMGRDIMINSPDIISEAQLNELALQLKEDKKGEE
jgi:aspartyl-tRNA synthetase